MDGGKSSSIGGERDPGTSVLVPAPMDAVETGRWCDFAAASSSDASTVLVVSYGSWPGTVAAVWRERAGALPENFGIVTVDRETGRPTPPPPDGTDEGTVTVVDSADLTGIGIAVGDHLERWGDDASATVWFDSVTPLVRDVGLETAFQFLHVLGARLRRDGAVGYYHVDPDAHDPRSYAPLTYLFDEVWEPEPDADGPVRLEP